MPREDTQFKHGNKKNTRGRPRLPEELKQLKQNTTDQYVKALYGYLQLNPAKVNLLLQKEGNKLSFLDRGILHLMRLMGEGNVNVIFRVLERAFGKPEQPLTTGEEMNQRFDDFMDEWRKWEKEKK